MADELDNLEREVEREMALLRSLPAEPLDRACVDRVTAAVVAEAARIGRTRRRRAWVRVSLGAAAAVLLALGVRQMWPRTSATLSAPDADAQLQQWAAALDESDDRVAALAAEGWSRGDTGNQSEEDEELEELFHSVDQSLLHFEEL